MYGICKVRRIDAGNGRGALSSRTVCGAALLGESVRGSGLLASQRCQDLQRVRAYISKFSCQTLQNLSLTRIIPLLITTSTPMACVVSVGTVTYYASTCLQLFSRRHLFLHSQPFVLHDSLCVALLGLAHAPLNPNRARAASPVCC